MSSALIALLDSMEVRPQHLANAAESYKKGIHRECSSFVAFILRINAAGYRQLSLRQLGTTADD